MQVCISNIIALSNFLLCNFSVDFFFLKTCCWLNLFVFVNACKHEFEHKSMPKQRIEHTLP